MPTQTPPGSLAQGRAAGHAHCPGRHRLPGRPGMPAPLSEAEAAPLMLVGSLCQSRRRPATAGPLPGLRGHLVRPPRARSGWPGLLDGLDDQRPDVSPRMPQAIDDMNGGIRAARVPVSFIMLVDIALKHPSRAQGNRLIAFK